MTDDTNEPDDVDENADSDVEEERDQAGDTDEPGGESSEHAATTAKRGTKLLIVTGVLAVAAVALAAVLFFVEGDRSDLQAEVDREREIAQAASDFTAAVLTYDFTDVDASAAAIEELSTENFIEEYREGFQGNLRALIVESEARSTARVDEIFVNRTTGDTARVISIATADVRSAAQSRAEVTSFIDLAMVRIDGKWLVNEMTSLGSEGSILDEEGNPIVPPSDEEGESSGDDSSTSSTTATTSPAG